MVLLRPAAAGIPHGRAGQREPLVARLVVQPVVQQAAARSAICCATLARY